MSTSALAAVGGHCDSLIFYDSEPSPLMFAVAEFESGGLPCQTLASSASSWPVLLAQRNVSVLPAVLGFHCKVSVLGDSYVVAFL